MPDRIEWTIDTWRFSYWPYFLGSILSKITVNLCLDYKLFRNLFFSKSSPFGFCSRRQILWKEKEENKRQGNGPFWSSLKWLFSPIQPSNFTHIVWKCLHFNSLYLQIFSKISLMRQKIRVRADAVSIWLVIFLYSNWMAKLLASSRIATRRARNFTALYPNQASLWLIPPLAFIKLFTSITFLIWWASSFPFSKSGRYFVLISLSDRAPVQDSQTIKKISAASVKPNCVQLNKIRWLF